MASAGYAAVILCKLEPVEAAMPNPRRIVARVRPRQQW
jgi:hypothetical protein